MVWAERFKKNLDWFLVKLQRIITFALVIKISIILYAFGVEFNYLPCQNLLCRLFCGLISLLSLCMSSCFLNCFTLYENLSHSLFFVVWYMPLECLHSGLGLNLSVAFLIHMHIGIWFRQFFSVSLLADEPTLNCFRWYSFLSLHTLSLFYSSLQALSLKNHDYSYLRKFWSFGIVLGMGAQLSVVTHNKCGCVCTYCWFF